MMKMIVMNGGKGRLKRFARTFNGIQSGKAEPGSRVMNPIIGFIPITTPAKDPPNRSPVSR